jgi:hypothetical protein
MMSDDRFLDRLRRDAQQLRYEPANDALWRLSARVQERIRSADTPAGLLAQWFRPVAAAFAALALVATLSVVWIEQNAEPVAIEAMAAAPAAIADLAIDGETLGVE